MTFPLVLIGIILLGVMFIYIQRRKIVSLGKEVGSLEHTIHGAQELNRATNIKLKKISKLEKEINEKIKTLRGADAVSINAELNNLLSND